MASKAFFLSISSIPATIAPVHAPVPGSGMPTNKTSPQKPYFSIEDLFLSTFLHI